MKGVLLCGGEGTRLYPITHTLPKQLIPLANVPLIEYIIRRLIECHIKDIAVVISKNEDKFYNYFNTNNYPGCKIKFYYQTEPLGLAHALLCAKDFIDDSFVLILGDNFFDFSLFEYLKSFHERKLHCLLLTKKVGNPSEFGVVLLKDNKIAKVIEKPEKPISNLAVTGIYFFTPDILEAASRIKPSLRGEYEITDAIQYLIDKKYSVSLLPVNGMWMDIGRIQDVFECSNYILCKLKKSYIIDINTKIINSVIGPNTVIGSNCIIKDAVVSNSIVMNGCTVDGVKLNNSIICYNSKITGSGEINGVFPCDSTINL